LNSITRRVFDLVYIKARILSKVKKNQEGLSGINEIILDQMNQSKELIEVVIEIQRTKSNAFSQIT